MSRHVPVVDASRVIQPKRFDTLMEALLNEDGDLLVDTANGFYAIAQKVKATRLVLWLNEHFGDIRTTEGKTFVETEAYRQSAHRLSGTMTLYRRNPATFGEDLPTNR